MMKLERTVGGYEELYVGRRLIAEVGEHTDGLLLLRCGKLGREWAAKLVPHLIAFAETGSLAIQSDEQSATSTRPQS